ncbi:MAG TPA: hypothetical protein VMS74_10385 [Acidimicrobiia bacterium]|nr:hypothetical protein [Acidimicrobiia bacterium]
MRRSLPVLVAGAGAVTIALLAGTGAAQMGTVILVLVLTVVIVPIGWRLTGDRDPWLWWVVALGFFAKLTGSSLRYWVLVSQYGGVGDATGYHGRGIRLAESWRTLQIPALDGGMSVGTQATRWVTGLLYAPYQPTMLGGFFLFGTLAFLGQVLFYTAFRRTVPAGNLKVYAFFIFFLPALVFWPSSIGKESLMLFCLGTTAYGLARTMDGFRPVWLLVAAVGIGGAGLVRPHIAALVAAAFTVAVVAGRSRLTWWSLFRRLGVLGVGVVLVVVSLGTFGDRYGVEAADDVDPFLSELQRRTQQGGSSVEGEAVLSLRQLPGGTLRVLFRPLPHEATNPQALASGVESAALLAVIIWKLPAMVRRIRRIRTPYLLMSFAFTVGFTVAFSAVFNLGILARQRSQVLPFLLAVLVGLGWESRSASGTTEASDPELVTA